MVEIKLWVYSYSDSGMVESLGRVDVASKLLVCRGPEYENQKIMDFYQAKVFNFSFSFNLNVLQGEAVYVQIPIIISF